MYRTLTGQTLHYFARPQTEVRREPVAGPAAWRSAEMARVSDWRSELREAEIEELDRALEHARNTGKSAAELQAADFPLPTLAVRIRGWRRELDRGRGFVVLRGVPVDRWSQEDSETFFWCFGHHLGIPGAQNPMGDLLGHVRDTGADPEARDVRQYRTAAHIPFHCDAADVVGLLCLRAARKGGSSRIVSSVSVYNELLRRRPDLVDRLYEPFLMDTKGQGGVDYFGVTPTRYADGRLRTFWHSDYFRTVSAFPDVHLDAHGAELLEVYDAIADEPEYRVDMDFLPGDVQLISNHTILHSRTAYEDHDEPERKRHLLRLWLSLPRPRGFGERVRAARSLVGLARQLGSARVRRLVHGPAPRDEPAASDARTQTR